MNPTMQYNSEQRRLAKLFITDSVNLDKNVKVTLKISNNDNVIESLSLAIKILVKTIKTGNKKPFANARNTCFDKRKMQEAHEIQNEQLKILALILKSKKGLTASDIALEMNLSKNEVMNRVADLKKDGRLNKRPFNRQTFYADFYEKEEVYSAK